MAHHPTHRDEHGASSVEYGLVVSAIAALVVVVMFTLGGPAIGLFNNACTAWTQADPQANASCD